LRHKEFFQSLVDRGFVVVAHDHLGFGRSHGVRGDVPKPYMYTRDVLEVS
jgi:alpha-beta hydrolase superfamily lysophospholipase